MDITESSEERPIADDLDTLERHIQQKESGGGNLVLVAAGKQDGADYNFVSFFVPPGVSTQPPRVTLVAIKEISQPLLDTDSMLTTDEEAAAEATAEQTGKTIIFIAPIFDAGTMKAVAVCRDGVADPILQSDVPLAGLAVPGPPAAGGGGVEKEFVGTTSRGSNSPRSEGHFRGSSSVTEGLRGTETTYADGTYTIDASEQLSAVRDGRNLGSKEVRQVRTGKDGVQVVKQGDYCWLNRTLPDAILVDDFQGFPEGTAFRSGKATQFGKFDAQDEGTGSELLKVVQTNSDVFGVSLKKSLLAATFGTPLGGKPDLLSASVEVFNPDTRRFARVPIVDVGPREDLEAQIDLTLALDRFLGTDGGGRVQFRIVS